MRLIENQDQNKQEYNIEGSQFSEESVVEVQRPRLTWIDLVGTLLGIVVLYLGIGYIMAWISGWWEYERILLYINGFMTQGAFLLMILVIMKVRKWSWQDFGWRKVGSRYAGSVITFYILTWIINISYVFFLVERGFTPPDTDVYSKLMGNATVITFCLNLILAGLLAPIIEETVFRGIIFGSLQTYMGKWTAAGLSAAIFSGLHFQSYGFFPRFVLGMVLAYLVMEHKSIKPSVALHAVNNIVALLLVVLSEGALKYLGQ